MAKVVQQPGPMMGAPAGFHHHLGRRELAEEGFHLGAFEIAPQDGAVELVHAMQREDVLGGVDGDALILHADGPWLRMTTQLWHAMPWGRPPQQRPRPLTVFYEEMAEKRALCSDEKGQWSGPLVFCPYQVALPGRSWIARR